MEQQLQDFKNLHSNKFNIYFHFVCSLTYMTLLFNLLIFDGIASFIYTLFLIFNYPSYIVEILVLYLLISIYSKFIPSGFIITKLILILVLYSLTKISNIIVGEKTTLDGHIDTDFIIQNFFFMPLYSVITINERR